MFLNRVQDSWRIIYYLATLHERVDFDCERVDFDCERVNGNKNKRIIVGYFVLKYVNNITII